MRSDRTAHPDWFEAAADVEHTAGGITDRLRNVRTPGPGLLEASMDDERDGAGWTHSFRTERVGDQQLATALQHAGLSLRDFRTDDGTWVRAGLDPSRPPPDSPG